MKKVHPGAGAHLDLELKSVRAFNAIARKLLLQPRSMSLPRLNQVLLLLPDVRCIESKSVGCLRGERKQCRFPSITDSAGGHGAMHVRIDSCGFPAHATGTHRGSTRQLHVIHATTAVEPDAESRGPLVCGLSEQQRLDLLRMLAARRDALDLDHFVPTQNLTGLVRHAAGYSVLNDHSAARIRIQQQSKSNIVGPRGRRLARHQPFCLIGSSLANENTECDSRRHYRKQAQDKPSAPLGSVTPFGRMTCLAVKFD